MVKIKRIRVYYLKIHFYVLNMQIIPFSNSCRQLPASTVRMFYSNYGMPPKLSIECKGNFRIIYFKNYTLNNLKNDNF